MSAPGHTIQAEAGPMRLLVAKDEDIPAVVTLMNAAFRGTGPQASWNTEAAHIDGDRTSEALLREEIAATPDAVLLIVRAGPASPLQGSVWLEPVGDGAWYLGSLTVAPELQNAGAGRRLLDAAEAWIVGHGGLTVRMTVVNVRDTLIAWYIRRGYSLTGDVTPFPYDDPRFGVPKRADLAFVALTKSLPAPAADQAYG